MRARHGVGAIGIALAAGGAGWWGTRPPAVSPTRQHLQAVVQSSERLHYASIGLFHPPASGVAPDTQVIELMSAGDKVHTYVAMYVADRMYVFLSAAPTDKSAAAAQVRNAIATVRAELPPFDTVTDPVVSMARDDLKTAITTLEGDLPK